MNNAEFKPTEHLIDCDSNPFVPNGWSVEEHQKGGQFKWDPDHVRLHLDEGQKNGEYIEGNKLRKKLAGKPVLNANVLDYLLAHPHLIPEEWKKDENGNIHYIFFWGTIYRYAAGDLCVRCLGWYGLRWNWDGHWLALDWHDYNPAALRAS